MKYKILLFFLILSCVVEAQKPVAKVDINIGGRRPSEVNVKGYTPWVIPQASCDSITVSGVTFILKATKPAGATLRSSWSKELVQSPYFMRLVSDGVQIENEDLQAHPGVGAAIELHIKGLPKGVHLLQTYHNVWEDSTKAIHAPINVYLNGKLLDRKVSRSVQAIVRTNATIVETKLNVLHDNQEMVLRFEADPGFVPTAGKTANRNVCIDGFELNTPSLKKQAREPVPANHDLHANADNGEFKLQWKPAFDGNVVSHILYFGVDSAAVATATTDDVNICKGNFPADHLSYPVKKLYDLNTYYWRVDERDSEGTVTKGKIWSFKPRHLAFPGAEGYGRFAIGGRGGKVVYVTNLNDDGPGSFREAVTSGTGPRTVLFNVSGIIYLKSRLVCDHFVTIAGQTAPGKGICFRAAPVGVGKESITRFLRVRIGAGRTYDGMGMAGVNNGIIDHCSISWTIDEAFSSRNAKNITLQRTLISEALNIAGHKNYPPGTSHGYAATISGDIGTFHHNLLADCAGRNWSIGGGLDGNGYYAGRLDIFNNVVYNWGHRATDGGAHQVDFVNNYYKEGPATTLHLTYNAQLEGTGKGTQSCYYAGNILQNTDGTFACDGTDNTCGRKYTLSHGQVLDWKVFVEKPFFPSYAKIQSAKNAYKSVLSDVGCNQPVLDDHDKRIIRETMNGTVSYKGSVSGLPGLIDKESDAGGYENYPVITRPADFDSDMDGLPDWWEKLNGTNPNSPEDDFSDANADPDRNGYTALEDYLEWLAVPHYYLTTDARKTIDLTHYARAYNEPTFSASSAAGFKLDIDGSRLIVTPESKNNGISYINVNVKDKQGSTNTIKIGLCVGVDAPGK
ncbi:MAG TPA: hypothetical protein VKA27_15520 [Sunxiuqinia sp.]|nr:hypothetical protein [Sunxiuqinia sp.]